METKHFVEKFRQTYEQLKGTGSFGGFFMLSEATALILDLDLVKNILVKDYQSFAELGFFCNERENPPSEDGRQLRTELTPVLSLGRLKLMFLIMCDIGERLVGVINAQIASHASVTIELKDLYDRFATDVTGTCIFGMECNSLEDSDTEFRVMNQNLFDNPRNHRAVDGLLYAFLKLLRFLRLKPDAMSDFYFKVFSETIEYRQRHNVKRHDLMSMLLDMKSAGSLTSNESVANAFLFFFAAIETSSTTMTLALYELAQNMEYQERLRMEIHEKLEEYDGEFSYECSQTLTYLDQVIDETLRKHTIVPQLQRKALTNYVTGDPKYFIAEGTTVIIPVEAIHHDPVIYAEPEKFLPERFSAEELKKRHPMSWLPFIEGPRNCIGMNMDRMQMRVGLVLLLRNFRFTVVEQTPLKLEYYLQCPFLVPKSKILLGVERL